MIDFLRGIPYAVVLPTGWLATFLSMVPDSTKTVLPWVIGIPTAIVTALKIFDWVEARWKARKPRLKCVLAIGLVLTFATQLQAAEQPAADVSNGLGQIQSIITGLLVILSAVFGMIAKIKSDRASTVDVLIRAIEDFDNHVLKKTVKSAATEAGVEAVLHKAVKAVTSKRKK